jgi:hypothetical protein
MEPNENALGSTEQHPVPEASLRAVLVVKSVQSPLSAHMSGLQIFQEFVLNGLSGTSHSTPFLAILAISTQIAGFFGVCLPKRPWSKTFYKTRISI